MAVDVGDALTLSPHGRQTHRGRSEIRRGAPRPARSLHVARADLNLDVARIIYPGRSRIDFDDSLAAMHLADFLEELQGNTEIQSSDGRD